MERTWTKNAWIIVMTLALSWGWGVMLAEARESKRTLEQFLAEKRDATMATIRADGTSQLTPVWFHWDGEQFYISTTRDRAKYKNLKQDSRMSLCIDDVTGFSYVVAEGKAEIKEQDIWEDTRKILSKYRGEKGGEEYLERMKSQPRVLVILKPERMEKYGLSG
jgi:PPOX class probable F420-dependent enzyme